MVGQCLRAVNVTFTLSTSYAQRDEISTEAVQPYQIAGLSAAGRRMGEPSGTA